MIEVKELRARASGQWPRIIRKLLPDIEHAVSQWERGGAQRKRHVGCPYHKGTTQSNFRLVNDFDQTGGAHCNTCGSFANGIDLIMFATRMNFSETIAEIAAELGMVEGGAYRPQLTPRTPVAPIVDPMEAAKIARETIYRREELHRIWRESLSIRSAAAHPAKLYLARRGLTGDVLVDFLRFHPSLPYYHEGKLIGSFSCILARHMTPDGKRAVTIQRIYITEKGFKAPVPEGADVKKMMPPPHDVSVTGTSVMLTPHREIQGVGEGVETMLAVKMNYPDIGIAAATTTSLLAGYIWPETTKLLVVFADKDRSGGGQLAASKLIERALAVGLPAIGYQPGGDIPEGKKSLDWNNVLELYGARGFPRIPTIPEVIAPLKQSACA
jgi:hypothetical protein